MDGFTPGWGDCCCEMDSCACESCAMGGARDSCAAWREHYYWNHLSDDKKQFLVLASGDFRHSLRIPPEIGSHLRNMISEFDLVKLEAPSGPVYPVEVSRELGVIVLRSGWNKFVGAHQIEENFSILFMYRGDSTFKVQIFDSAGQERPLFCSQPPSGISGAVPPRALCDHHVLKEQVVPDPGHVQNSTDFVYTILSGCPLIEAQDKKVLEIADTMKSEIPLHVAAMSKSNVSLKNCYVCIPLGLVDHFKEEIKLEAPDNNTYSVGASKHSDHLIAIESGWNDFVASLLIQENDLLIFIRKGKNRLEVLILDPSGREKTSSRSVMENLSSSAQEMFDDSPRAVIDLTSPDDDDIVREGMRKSCRAQKWVTHSGARTFFFFFFRERAGDLRVVVLSSKEKDQDQKNESSTPRAKLSLDGQLARHHHSVNAKSDEFWSLCLPCESMVRFSVYDARRPHGKAFLKLGPCSEPLSRNLRGPFRRPYILSQQTILPMQLKRKVEEKVQAIGSELPIFVRAMTATNIDGSGKSLAEVIFGMVYASACLPDETQPLLLQLEGRNKQWHAMLSVASRKTRRVYYGWKEFVGDNQLKVGDVCLFEVSSRNNTSLTMTVHLVR